MSRLRHGQLPKRSNRPRDSSTMYRKFLEWNLHEEGKRLSPLRSSSYWHRDDIFYRNWRPIARLVHTPGGGVVMFLKYDEWFGGRNDHEDLMPKDDIIDVDDVGCIGPSGLALPLNEYLQLVLNQFVGKATHLVDLIASVSPKGAWDHNNSKKVHEKLHANGERNYQFHQHTFEGWAGQIRKAGEKYDRVNELFDLGQPAFDFEALNLRFWEIVDEKAAVHDLPKNAKKRERWRARQDAIRALNLDREVTKGV